MNSKKLKLYRSKILGNFYSKKGNTYDFLYVAKGGGSANKSYLYQQTKALLNKPRLMKFIDEKIKTLGTAACPPYHLALVIGGLSAELTMKIVKLASCKYLDDFNILNYSGRVILSSSNLP